MDDVLGEAQRIAPLEEGTLAASGDRRTEENARGVTVIAYFAQVYALRQHEELAYTHRAGRKAKYLEAPFKAKVGQYPAGLARALGTVT